MLTKEPAIDPLVSSLLEQIGEHTYQRQSKKKTAQPLALHHIYQLKVTLNGVYEYDFGDSWEHTVVVEQILPSEKGAAYPRCIDGNRTCPPEDVGGVNGYSEFLAAIHDPRHPEHAEWLQWAGNSFDPEAFDLQKINELLQTFYSHLMVIS